MHIVMREIDLSLVKPNAWVKRTVGGFFKLKSSE